MKSHLNILSCLQGAGALPFADELLPFADRVAREALEALSPTRCAGCERAGTLICQDCLAALTLIDPRHSCTRCGAPFGDLLCTECSVEGTSSAMAEALDRCLACAVYVSCVKISDRIRRPFSRRPSSSCGLAVWRRPRAASSSRRIRPSPRPGSCTRSTSGGGGGCTGTR